MFNNRIVKNTVSLYAMNIAKMILPLVTLPYLTRVLSKDSYGVVSYVKATMQYMQLIIDFGFLLSGTKDIVRTRDNPEQMAREVSGVFNAKLLLGLCSGGVLLILTMFIDILRENMAFTLLSFVPVFLTCFLFDYLFRGIEQMHIITIRFVAMKTISSVLTFALVHSDADVLMIPILDIIGTLVAIVLVFAELHKLKIRLCFTPVRETWNKIKESAVYFASDIATTAFGALNTLLIGIYITEAEVANWSLCMQLVTAVQSLYSPIINGIYPEMIKSRNVNIVKRVLKIFVPLIGAGCIFTLLVAKYALLIVGGPQYTDAAWLLRSFVPVMFFGFLSMVFGWPILGAIGRIKETSTSTICAALIQVAGLVVMILINQFTLINIALLRGFTEIFLFAMRFVYCWKFRHELSSGQ